MTKTEKQTIQKFIGELANKNFSTANNLLEQVVAEKIKKQVRTSVQKDKN